MMNKFDLQNDDYNYLDDLMRDAPGENCWKLPWKRRIFPHRQRQKRGGNGGSSGLDEEITKDFLQALAKLGLVGISGGYVFNTPVAARHLDRASHLWSVRKLDRGCRTAKISR